MEKHSVSRLSYLFAHLCLLSSYSFSSDLLSSNLPLLSASALLCFSSVHIVGSLTSKLPSIITYIYTYIEGPTLQLRYCLTYCSIATVACIWYIGFLPPTLFGASCRCNFLSVVSFLGSMTRNVVDLSQLLLAFFKLRIAKNIFDRYLTKVSMTFASSKSQCRASHALQTKRKGFIGLFLRLDQVRSRKRFHTAERLA